MKLIPRRLALLVSTVALAGALAGCTASSDPLGDLRRAAGVAGIDTYGNSATVTMAGGASDEQVQDVAALIPTVAPLAGWSAVTLTREPLGPQPPWSLQVHPGDPDTVSTELRQILSIEKAGGSASVIDGWPYVTVSALDGFRDLFHELSGKAMFADGGTFTLQSDKHLQIVHVPARSSDESIDAIIQLAIDYPDAEVLLQAPTAGPQWPTLYVARLTPEQVTEIQARLLDPTLADSDIEGYPMPFMLTTIGADGPVYTSGNLGGVPG